MIIKGARERTVAMIDEAPLVLLFRVFRCCASAARCSLLVRRSLACLRFGFGAGEDGAVGAGMARLVSVRLLLHFCVRGRA